MIFELFGDRLRDPQKTALHPFTNFLETIVKDLIEVVRSLDQRRQLDGQYTDTVEKILAKRAFGDASDEVAMSGGDNANIETRLARTTDRHHAPGLQEFEKAGLQSRRKLADLIEKHGSALRLLKPADSPELGSGECASLMAEELRL